MKFSEKMLLIKQGATLADIKKLEEEEAAEIAEGKNNNSPIVEPKDPKPKEVEPKEDNKNEELLSALEASKLALEEATKANEKLKTDYEALNEEFIKLTNKQTVQDPEPYTGVEVFDELFNNHKSKEES